MNRRIKDLTVEQLQAVKQDWDAGAMPQSVIAAKHRLNVDDLKAYAKANWDRPMTLNQRIEHETTKALIDRTVSDARKDLPQNSLVTQDRAEQLRQYGQIAAGVVESHRKILARAMAHTSKIMTEIEAFAPLEATQEAITGLAQAIAEQNPELAKALTEDAEPMTMKKRAALLTFKVALIHDLASPLSKFIELEREAYGLDKAEGDKETYDDFLDEINGEDGGKPALKVVK